MAFSALRQCRRSMQGSLYIRNMGSSIAPKLAASPKVGMFKKFTSGLGHAAAPIGVMGAMVVVTVTQHFVRSPSVPEVDQPDASIRSGENFVDKSFPPEGRSPTCKTTTTPTQIYTRDLANLILCEQLE